LEAKIMKKPIGKKGFLRSLLVILALAVLGHFPVYDTVDWVGTSDLVDCISDDIPDCTITVKITNISVQPVFLPLSTWNFDIFIHTLSLQSSYSENEVNWVIGEVKPEHPI